MSNSFKSKELLIQEKRTIEATRKNMMGASGKLGSIAKWLGHKIVRQGGGLFDSSYLDDPFFEDHEESMPTFEDSFTTDEGYHFDGLSRGMHLEIQYSHGNTELKVHYKGYLVYREVAGDLLAYGPFPDWEDMVEKLYEDARKVAERHKEVSNEEKEQSLFKKSQMYLYTLKMRWGI